MFLNIIEPCIACHFMRRRYLQEACVTMDSPFASSTCPTSPRHSLDSLRRYVAIAVTLCTSACALGPDYRQPTVQVPQRFKEGAQWERAQANPQGSLTSEWWTVYHDDKLSALIQQSQQANQTIAASEAAYRVSQAVVEANTASLFPVVTAGLSASRTGAGSAAAAGGLAGTGAAGATGAATRSGVANSFAATAAASWELDLWGAIRRQIEAAKSSAEASDAQLAGARLSVASSLAVDYFELREADIDIQLLKEQQDIDQRILDMTRAAYTQGVASTDQILDAQDTLEIVVADLQTTEASREQDEHAIAVLVGEPPAAFSLPADLAYTFALPDVPLAVPSQLLERRYDVVSAERTAAAANAQIGVAIAAFFPTLTLSAQGGFQHNTFAHLFSLPSRVWTLGPDLAATIFDGGARSAAVHQARATYDEDVANYRNTVLTAFQNVEDSLSSVNHLRQQEQAFANVFKRNQQLFASEQAQLQAGTVSEQDELTERLTLIQAQQNLSDTQALLTQGSVTLIKNLGGGWQWDSAANVDGKPNADDTASASGTASPNSAANAGGATDANGTANASGATSLPAADPATSAGRTAPATQLDAAPQK
jgi:NodT family efflux transporter outer membrane factor (OMF) lipoprotein